MFLVFGLLYFWHFISVFAYVLAPDNSQYANQMHLPIHSKQPGFTDRHAYHSEQFINESEFFESDVFWGYTIAPLKYQ